MIQITKYGSMFYLIPSKLDFDAVNGVFGTYNNDPSDDFSILRNGSTTTSQELFFDSYK